MRGHGHDNRTNLGPLCLIPPGKLACLVAVVEGRLRGHGDADLTPLEFHAVEPPESGVGGGRLFVLDDAVALGLSRRVVLVDPHGERPLVLVAPLLLGNKKCDHPLRTRAHPKQRLRDGWGRGELIQVRSQSESGRVQEVISSFYGNLEFKLLSSLAILTFPFF